MKSISRFPRWGAVLAVLLFGGFHVPDAAAARVVPTHEDIWLMKRVGPPQVSPDGRWIVVQVTEPSYDENNQLSDLWLIDTSARNSSRRLTSTRRPESGVIWSPDSRRIVFSAQRDSDEVPQLYSLDLSAGGEAQRLTNLSGGARAPVFVNGSPIATHRLRSGDQITIGNSTLAYAERSLAPAPPPSQTETSWT